MKSKVEITNGEKIKKDNMLKKVYRNNDIHVDYNFLHKINPFNKMNSFTKEAHLKPHCVSYEI